MLLNFFKKNNFLNQILLIFFSFILGMISFMSYLLSNFMIFDSIILILSCYSQLYSIIILCGQLSCILLISKFCIFLPETIQTIFTFEIVLKIIIFFMFRMFLYSFFFKKILQEFDFKKILKTFIYFGFLNILLSIIYLVIVGIFNNLNIFKPMFIIHGKINILIKIFLLFLNQINNTPLNNLNNFINMSSIGINSMMLNISLFYTSLLASIFLSFLTKNNMNEMFQKFNSTIYTVNNKYKIFLLLLLIISIILYLLKLNLLCIMCWGLFLSLFFIFFIIGRNLLLLVLDKFFSNNYFLSILILMILNFIIPNFNIILIIIGCIISIFNL